MLILGDMTKLIMIKYSQYPRRSTIKSETSERNLTWSEFAAVGWTLLNRIAIIKSLSLSAQMDVPVNPVWPNELFENLWPHGGLS